MAIADLLGFCVRQNSSDLHLSAGMPPLIRVDGDLRPIDLPEMSELDVLSILHEMMNDRQRKEFETNFECDFSFDVKDLARFRVNAYHQARGVGAAFRSIPSIVPTMDSLHFPNIFKDICTYPWGLVLVTGPTGSGKSTTLASMIDYINKRDHSHIITIEDPIEFTYMPKKCLINQREIFRHTASFSNALRSALREDPDIILVGELRDLETIRLALTAAETGHLVFATLHTNSASKAINRIVDAFPGDEKGLVRIMLSECLQAVIAQTLIKRVGGGRVAALEIMLCNAAIRNLIRENKVAQMYSSIQTGQAQGMQTLDQHLAELVNQGIILKQTASEVALNKSAF